MPADWDVTDTLALMAGLRQRIVELESECGDHAEVLETVQAMKRNIEDLIVELKWLQLLNNR